MAVDYEDTYTIATPEGIRLSWVLAGVGSRFLAILVDSVLQVTVMAALFLLAGSVFGFGSLVGGVRSLGAGLAVAALTVTLFVVMFGYWVAFEVLASGRTPGKRLMRIRVVGRDGRPVGTRASILRTLLRLVDMIPSFYLVGTIAVVASRSNQRLGDMVAGTIVVRDAHARKGQTAAVTSTVQDTAGAQTWDVTAVSPADLSVVERFLARRATLDLTARQQLAERLADTLRPRVSGWDSALDPEQFLETLAEAKRSRRR